MKWYDKKWVIWLAIIIFFPLGWLMMMRTESFGLKAKTIATIIMAVLVVCGYGDINRSKTPVPPQDVQLYSKASDENFSIPKTEIRTEIKYRGRGNDGRSEPQYIGMTGYISVWHEEDSGLLEHLNYVNTPWQIPTYERDKQFWIMSEKTLNHKDKIIVREQFLVHEGYDWYKGYLKVRRISDGQEFYINVRNFIVKPYWEEKNVTEAVKGGRVIVTYHQKSDYYPVSVNNKKAEVPDGLNLLAGGLTGTYGGNYVSRFTHQIRVDLSTDLSIFFNEADLEVSY